MNIGILPFWKQLKKIKSKQSSQIKSPHSYFWGSLKLLKGLEKLQMWVLLWNKTIFQIDALVGIKLYNFDSNVLLLSFSIQTCEMKNEDKS